MINAITFLSQRDKGQDEVDLMEDTHDMQV